jgi:hypothetical protein
MRLEVAWILANLTYASDEVCYELLTEGTNEPRTLSCIVEFLKLGLSGNTDMLDLVSFTLSNLCSEKFARTLLDNTHCISTLMNLMQEK